MSRDVTTIEAAARLEAWLRDSAIPFWASSGTDVDRGGFFERFHHDGRSVDDPRRTRVVARQIYVFATALRHAWIDSADTLIQHGLDFLLTKLRLESGTYLYSADATGKPVNATFGLYEHAFVLFAMAAAYRAQPDRSELPGQAAELLERMREGWGHTHELGGFHETAPPSAPLQSNPHMHLFEAMLEWSAADPDGVGKAAGALADEIAELCMARFISPFTGALHEYFDLDWNRLSDHQHSVVEPGHQFEWAWLLMRWGTLRGRSDAISAATRLVAIGETYGVDHQRGVAINELNEDLSIRSADAKLWPQTERIKAWCAMAELHHGDTNLLAEAATESASESASEYGALERTATAAERNITLAVDGLLAYTTSAPRGLWHEVWHADGSFSTEPTRASSLYHIVCAADTLIELHDH